MSNQKIVFLSFLLSIFFTTALFGQDENLGTEVVNIVKPYTPSISDAFKVKETPVLNDSISTQKKAVQYSIFSVPVASTFTPAKGKAATVEKAKPIKLYDNYASFGFGNYASVLAELFSNFEISRTDNAGFLFRHNSSQGGIKDVRLDDKFYDTGLDGNYTSRQLDASYRLDGGIKHQVYNWYGLPESFDSASSELIDSIDPQQTYFSGYLGGNVVLDEGAFDQGAMMLRYLGDAFSSSEFYAEFQPEFSFPITDMTLKVEADFNFLSGGFDRDFFTDIPINYGFFNAGIIPAIQYVNEDLTVSLGVAAYVSLDTENSDTNFSISPRISASYRLMGDELIAYGGADGGLLQNTYYDYKEFNPFVSPTLAIMPTTTLYDAFVGIKGKLANSVSYNLRSSYGNSQDVALFQINPQNSVAPVEAYQYGNSFQVVYDDIKTLAFFGELKVEVSELFALGITGEYFSYNTTNQSEAWNLPNLKATLFSTFTITEQIFGGASFFFVGERKDQVVVYGDDISPLPVEVTLDGYIDLNVHLGYKVNERMSVFIKGSNLLSDNYLKWYNYPVQGIQGLIGATYKFDW